MGKTKRTTKTKDINLMLGANSESNKTLCWPIQCDSGLSRTS